MTHDRWPQRARDPFGMGRLLPLGSPEDGAWLAESAAREVLRRTAQDVPGVSPGTLRIGAAPTAPDTGPTAARPPVSLPPGALPPGPLRLTLEFALLVGHRVPQVAAHLREVLWSEATAGLGLPIDTVDLTVTALLDAAPPPADHTGPDDRQPAAQRPREPYGDGAPATPGTDGAGPGPTGHGDDTGAPGPRDDSGDVARVAAAVEAVPGVARLGGRFAGPGRPVDLVERPGADGHGATPPARHVRVEITVARGQRPLDVARAVRGAASRALVDRPAVAVLVMDLE